MFIYSVTISIDTNYVNEWLEWMKNKHVPDVMSTGCFKEYNIYQVYSADLKEAATYNIQYSFESIEDLERYQKNFASQLQEEHKNKFMGKYIAIRTVLRKIN